MSSDTVFHIASISKHILAARFGKLLFRNQASGAEGPMSRQSSGVYAVTEDIEVHFLTRNGARAGALSIRAECSWMQSGASERISEEHGGCNHALVGRRGGPRKMPANYAVVNFESAAK